MFNFSAKRIALLSMLTAMASVTFLIEGLFPPMFIPGAKMGLSNIFSMLAVVLLSPIDGIILVAVRTTLGSLLVGNLSSWMYSFAAGVASVAVTGFLYWLLQNKVSLVSQCGGCGGAQHHAKRDFLPYNKHTGVVCISAISCTHRHSGRSCGGCCNGAFAKKRAF